ncbi:hypothetical protein HJFPF1_01839 [Paramyrothecium foliicola]|nr:hypothetical protein HJFPF1_01839 [Paramyrothecium foliicola]
MEAIDKFEPLLVVLFWSSLLPMPALPGYCSQVHFLSRETLHHVLELLLKAFGCKRVGRDAVPVNSAFTVHEIDPATTPQIVDRPPI